LNFKHKNTIIACSPRNIFQAFLYSSGAQPVDRGLLVDRRLFPSRPRGPFVKIIFFLQWLPINCLFALQ